MTKKNDNNNDDNDTLKGNLEGGEFRTIPVDQNSHPRFAILSGDAKLLWYLMRTSRHHKRTGLFLFPVGEFLHLMFPVSGLFERHTADQVARMETAFEELISAGWIETETPTGNPGAVFVFMTVPQEASGKNWRPTSNSSHRKNFETDLAQYRELRLMRRVFESFKMEVPDDLVEEVAEEVVADLVEEVGETPSPLNRDDLDEEVVEEVGVRTRRDGDGDKTRREFYPLRGWD